MPEMSTLTMNGNTYEVVDKNHRNDKNNPHSVTPAQIGAMANTSAAWLPQNGMSIRDFPDGITMYSVHPGNMVAEGAPDGFSGYATVTAFRYAEYDYYEYTDVFGKKAIWNTNDNSGWQRVYTDNHKPTAADVGAVPITGGTINGVLNVGGKVELRTDPEGGNIKITPRDGTGVNHWEMDAHDGNIRFYAKKSDGSYVHPLYLRVDGSIGSENPAQTRANLGITPAEIGAVAITKVWENASPTSAFAQQHISIDLSSYSHVAINFGFDNNFTRLSGWYIFAKNAPKYGRASEVYDQYGIARDVMYVLDNGVSFAGSIRTELSDGSYADGYGRQMIPYQIYGIKGVL